MSQVSHKDRYALEECARLRREYRARAIEHKQERRIHIGDHAALCFEDAMRLPRRGARLMQQRIYSPSAVQREREVIGTEVPPTV